MGAEPPGSYMSGNRVEELEKTVTELESTVSGLTEELVEAKERIRDLEAELEPQPADGSAFPEADPEEVREAVAQAEGDGSEHEHEGGEAEAAAQAAARDDVERFDAEAGAGDETDTADESEGEDDSGFEDDIIVA